MKKRLSEERCGKCAGWEWEVLDLGTCTYLADEPLTYRNAPCRAFSMRGRGKLFTPFPEGGEDGRM